MYYDIPPYESSLTAEEIHGQTMEDREVYAIREDKFVYEFKATITATHEGFHRCDAPQHRPNLKHLQGDLTRRLTGAAAFFG
jgi:hypothetical protein